VQQLLVVAARVLFLGHVQRDHGDRGPAAGQLGRLDPGHQPAPTGVAVLDGIAHLDALALPQGLLQAVVVGHGFGATTSRPTDISDCPCAGARPGLAARPPGGGGAAVTQPRAASWVATPRPAVPIRALISMWASSRASSSARSSNCTSQRPDPPATPREVTRQWRRAPVHRHPALAPARFAAGRHLGRPADQLGQLRRQAGQGVQPAAQRGAQGSLASSTRPWGHRAAGAAD
jgi:hypothetical protein